VTAAADRSQRRRTEQGFTLLEILVVVVIIGVVITGAILSLGATGKDRALEQERDRLAAIAAYVRERGGMLTLEYGLRCGQHGYRFAYYDNRALRWLPETVDDTLRPRRLPAGLRLRLVVEGHDIVLDDAALTITPASTLPPGGTLSALGTGVTSLNVTTSDDTPQIMLFSNGDTNAFALTIERENTGRSATLQSTQDGTLKVGDILEAAR
jgi:general secretion pathway protein H